MAEEKEQQKKSIPVKKIALIGGGALIAVLITFAATYILLSNKLGTNNPKPEKPKEKEVKPIGPTFELADMSISVISDTGKSRFLSIKIVLELESEDMLEELEQRRPQLQDIAIKTIASQEYNNLLRAYKKDSEGTLFIEKFQEELREKINESIINGKVLSIYFSKFMFQ